MAATKAGGEGVFISWPAGGSCVGPGDGKGSSTEGGCPPAGWEIAACRALAVAVSLREDTTLWKGIPITSPPRTLVDLAAVK